MSAYQLDSLYSKWSPIHVYEITTSLLVLRQQRMSKPYPRDILPLWKMLFCFVSYFYSTYPSLLSMLCELTGRGYPTSFQWQEGGAPTLTLSTTVPYAFPTSWILFREHSAFKFSRSVTTSAAFQGRFPQISVTSFQLLLWWGRKTADCSVTNLVGTENSRLFNY